MRLMFTLLLVLLLLSGCQFTTVDQLVKTAEVVKLAETMAKNQFQTTQTAPVSGSQDNSYDASNWKFPRSSKVNQAAVAVVIGSRNYAGEGRDVPNVDFAINDARAIKQYLMQSLGFREGNILYYENASQADMISVFGNREEPEGRLFDLVRPGRSDVFVYYSGHGAPSLSSGRGYLLPVDADPRKVALNGYSLETLYGNLNKVAAKSMTVVIDACFSGSSQSGAVVRNASSISLKVVDVKKKLAKAAVLTASGVSEVASWDTEAKHGLFTRHFLEGVSGAADDAAFGNGDGSVTLAELKTYLQEEVSYNARAQHGRYQHPQISGDGSRVFALLR